MISFENYINEFNGNVIQNEDDFDRLAKRSVQFIKSTVSADFSEEDISQAVYALCDTLFQNECSDGIRSEKADGLSVTYEDNRLNKIMYAALRLYLPKKLLYRGLA